MWLVGNLLITIVFIIGVTLDTISLVIAMVFSDGINSSFRFLFRAAVLTSVYHTLDIEECTRYGFRIIYSCYHFQSERGLTNAQDLSRLPF